MRLRGCENCGYECMLCDKCRKCGWCPCCCNCWVNRLNDDFFNAAKHLMDEFISDKPPTIRSILINKFKGLSLLKKKWKCVCSNCVGENLDAGNSKPKKVYFYDFSNSNHGHYSFTRTAKLNFFNRAKALWRSCLSYLFKFKK